MKTLKKLLATGLKLVILAGLAGAGYYAYTQYGVEAEQDELGVLPTVVSDMRDITVSVSATGVLQPVKIVEIKSKASGEILEMPVEMGDFLRAGDLIAQIDTRIIDQEMKQAQADFESARIRLDISRRQLDRAESLRRQDLLSENDLETSQQNFTSAESQFIRAEASLELARERLADATVRAPIAGTVIAKSVEQGQIIASSTNNVSGGTVMLQMADLTELEIRTLVDEIDIGNVTSGLRVESKVEAFANMSFEGAVMKIEPQAVVEQSVTTFPVLSRIDNSEGLLLPGMNADVSIIIHERSGVLAVPNEAVRSVQDGREVIQLLGLELLPEDNRLTLAANVEATTPAQAVPSTASSPRDNGDAPNGDNGHAAYGEAGGVDSGRDGDDPWQTGDDSWGAGGLRREPGVVFMLGLDGTIKPRQIVTGVRDWEVAEVLAGLEVGEELVLLPSTSLLRSQQSMRERFARRNAVVPGAGR